MIVYAVYKSIPWESSEPCAMFELQYDAEAYALMRKETEGYGGYDYDVEYWKLNETEEAANE